MPLTKIISSRWINGVCHRCRVSLRIFRVFRGMSFLVIRQHVNQTTRTIHQRMQALLDRIRLRSSFYGMGVSEQQENPQMTLMTWKTRRIPKFCRPASVRVLEQQFQISNEGALHLSANCNFRGEKVISTLSTPRDCQTFLSALACMVFRKPCNRIRFFWMM